MTAFSHLIPIIILSSCFSCSLTAQEPASTNGKTLEGTIDFPELGPTLSTQYSHPKKQLPQLLYQLPSNYQPDKSYPVLVYLPGGSGDNLAQSGLARGKQIIQKHEYILVTLPLFRKAPINKADAFGGLHISHDDYEVISKSYSIMLTRFFAEVKQARPEGNILAGFSNGAHTIAVLVSSLDDFILNHFSSFIIIDGGQYINGFHRAKLKNYRFLALVGDSQSTKDDWERAVAIQYFKNIQATTKNNGIHFDLIYMKNTAHAFPSTYNESVYKWIQKGQLVGKSLPQESY